MYKFHESGGLRGGKLPTKNAKEPLVTSEESDYGDGEDDLEDKKRKAKKPAKPAVNDDKDTDDE